MPSLHDTAWFFAGALIFMALSIAVFGLPLSPQEVTAYQEPPDAEYDVTCYKWAENGTARVICPDKVYAPDSVVNITVKHCDEYEFVVDEPHPCYHDVETGNISLAPLPS